MVPPTVTIEKRGGDAGNEKNNCDLGKARL